VREHGVHPCLGFGWMSRHIPFDGEGRRGARRAKPLLSHHLARSTARSEHDASNRNLQSTNRYVCSRRSAMRPVRPDGTRTTDSSSPLAQPRPRWVGTEPGDACVRPLRRGSVTATDGSSSTATRPIPHRRTSRSTADPFNRREASSPIHDSRPAARTPGALSSPHSLLIGPRE
jgi:hypothetical protein